MEIKNITCYLRKMNKPMKILKPLKLFLVISLLSFTANAGTLEYMLNSEKKDAYFFMKNYDKAVQKYELEKVKDFFDDQYKSSDGFSSNDILSMIKKTRQAFPDMKYKSKINDISIYDDVVVVQITDVSKAKVYPSIDSNVKKSLAKRLKKEKMGVLDGSSSFVVYLRKMPNGSFKIISDTTMMEQTSLKYGVARKIKMDFKTPVFVQNGKQYDIALTIDKPEDIVALASLSREEIKYPPVESKEKYRKIPVEGPLERYVKANDKNLNEYATASVGFTKVSVNEEKTKARIEMLGMAYIVKRINMEKANNAQL